MNHLQAFALPHAQGMRHSDPPSSREWAKVLQTFPLFCDASTRRLRKLVRDATFAVFASGEIVLSRSGSGDALYVILGGSAKALSKPAARELRSGDYFGELALIDETPRSATVIATDELHVMLLPRLAVLRLSRREPAVTLVMLRNLSTQLRRLEAHVAQSA